MRWTGGYEQIKMSAPALDRPFVPFELGAS